MYRKLLKIYRFFLEPQNDEKKIICSYEEEMDYISRLHYPKDDFERSYFQYLCYVKVLSRKYRIVLLNLLSFLAFFFVASILFLKGLKKNKNVRKTDIIMTQDFVRDKRINNREITSYKVFGYMDGSLRWADFSYIHKIICRAGINWFFTLKTMLRIADYSKALASYNPIIVYCSAEYSYTSSVLTKYCEDNGAKHINVMHGEKSFYIREAFSRFTEFNVWDEHYISIFHLLRCDKTKYVIDKPIYPSIVVNKREGYCTYYLQDQSITQLRIIKSMLERTGLNYSVRPHPVYFAGVDTIFEKGRIENPREIDIWTSLSNAGKVISMSSTVLFQAYMCGVTTVIDDISDIESYNESRKRGYIMIEKADYKLSQLLAKEME